MAYRNSIKNQDSIYCVTFTVHQWIDVFTNPQYADVLLNSIEYYQKNKSLEVFAWVIMSNHCHLVVKAKNNNLSAIIEDLKKYTAKALIAEIKNNPKECRKTWLLWLLENEDYICFWEDSYDVEEILSKSLFDKKIQYLHQKPVKAGWVHSEDEYINSSCGDFYGLRKGRLVLANCTLPLFTSLQMFKNSLKMATH